MDTAPRRRSQSTGPHSHGMVEFTGGNAGDGEYANTPQLGKLWPFSKSMLPLLYGANVSSRSKNIPEDPHTMSVPPAWETFEPFESHLHRDSLRVLRELKFNVIRLMCFWECIEPKQGEYNNVYIEGIRKFIEDAAAHGILCIVDLHQDLYSRYLGGSGHPVWAHPPHVRKLIQGKAFRHCCNAYDHIRTNDPQWAGKYVTCPHQRDSWIHFWENHEDVQTHYINMLKYLSGKLKGTVGMIGYDLINESSCPAMYYAQVYVNHREKARSRQYIADFFTRALNDMVPVDKDVLYFVEPYTGDASMLLGDIGIAQLDIPDYIREQCVYAPHVYEPFIAPRFGTRGREILSIHMKTAAMLKMPVFIGEFGDLTMSSGSKRSIEVVNDHVLLMERLRMGWTVYNYSPSKMIWNGEDMTVADVKPGEPAIPRPVYTQALVHAVGRGPTLRTLSFMAADMSSDLLLEWCKSTVVPQIESRAECKSVGVISSAASPGRSMGVVSVELDMHLCNTISAVQSQQCLKPTKDVTVMNSEFLFYSNSQRSCLGEQCSLLFVSRSAPRDQLRHWLYTMLPEMLSLDGFWGAELYGLKTDDNCGGALVFSFESEDAVLAFLQSHFGVEIVQDLCKLDPLVSSQNGFGEPVAFVVDGLFTSRPTHLLKLELGEYIDMQSGPSGSSVYVKLPGTEPAGNDHVPLQHVPQRFDNAFKAVTYLTLFRLLLAVIQLLFGVSFF